MLVLLLVELELKGEPDCVIVRRHSMEVVIVRVMALKITIPSNVRKIHAKVKHML